MKRTPTQTKQALFKGKITTKIAINLSIKSDFSPMGPMGPMETDPCDVHCLLTTPKLVTPKIAKFNSGVSEKRGES